VLRALPLIFAALPIRDLAVVVFWIALILGLALARTTGELVLAGAVLGCVILIHGSRLIWQTIGWRYASRFGKLYWSLCGVWFVLCVYPVFQLPEDSQYPVRQALRSALMPASVGFLVKRILNRD
jgi:hypothetical protein